MLSIIKNKNVLILSIYILLYYTLKLFDKISNEWNIMNAQEQCFKFKSQKVGLYLTLVINRQ